MDLNKLLDEIQAKFEDLEEENKRFRKALEELDAMNEEGEGSKACVRSIIHKAGL
jgi:cell division septum initiation protein DivIVA